MTKTDKKHVSASEWRLVGLLNVVLMAVLVLTLVYGFICNYTHFHGPRELHVVSKTVHLVLGLTFIGLACVHIWVNKWWYERWGRGIGHSVWRWSKRCFGLLFGIIFAIVAFTGIGMWLWHWHVGRWHVVMGIIFMGLAAIHVVTNLRGLWRGLTAIVE